MARDPERKAELLASFVDYVLNNGLADLSLRPAAAALGTSPQILLYYFGSKEELISRAIAQVRIQEAGFLAREIARGRRQASPSEVLRRVWRWFTAKRRAPFARLFFEVYGLALQHPERFKEFLEAGRQFFALIEDAFVAGGFARAESRSLATLYLDTLRGMLLDYLVTGEHARVDATVKLVDRNLRRDLRRVRGRGRPRRAASRRV